MEKEVIAKIPNPNAGRPHLTTASEVATMDYIRVILLACLFLISSQVRDILKVPAPKVYAWNSSYANPVGAEDILMERIVGVEFDKLWDDMPGRAKVKVVQQLAQYDAAFATSGLSMYGSLYYATDLPDAPPSQMVLDGQQTPRFAVGPTTNRAYFDDLRSAVNPDLAPYRLLILVKEGN
jgi:hypothetical protein